MSVELVYLFWVAVFTALMWIPYILDRISAWGLVEAVGYPASPKPQSPWAQRLMKAHANAVENLVVFAPLVLLVHASGAGNTITAGACMVYFWARVVHAIAYTFAIPWVRTLAFAVGWFAMAAIAWQLLPK